MKKTPLELAEMLSSKEEGILFMDYDGHCWIRETSNGYEIDIFGEKIEYDEDGDPDIEGSIDGGVITSNNPYEAVLLGIELLAGKYE